MPSLLVQIDEDTSWKLKAAAAKLKMRQQDYIIKLIVEAIQDRED